MSLSPSESLFIERRERLTKHWPLFGAGSLCLVLGLVAWLWIKAPYFINPWIVSDRLERGVLPEPMMGLMAAMLPIVTLTLLVFSGVVVILAVIALRRERRMISLVQRENESRPD